MFESKFISILKNLSTRERSRFRDYVHSPFFNKHEATTALCDYILQFSAPYKDETLDKKAASKFLFPKEKYEEQRIYTLLSNLLNLMNNYLAQVQLEENEPMQKRLTLQALRKIQEEKQWTAVEKQYKIVTNRLVLKDENSLYEQYRYYEERDALFLSKALREQDENIQQKSDALDAFYLAAKLKTACDMQSRNIVINASYHSWALESLLKLLESDWENMSKHPAIAVYFAILKMLKSGEESDYFEVKKLLSKHLQDFDKEELKLQYDYAINYVIRQLNSSRPDWYREFLDLHQFLLEHEILLLDGELPEWDYKNIVTVGLRLDEFDWIEAFIHQYKDSVKKEVRENVFNYNLASLYFERKEYKKALQLLLQIDFTDASYHLGSKIIQLKSYYALKEWEAALSLMEAFRNLVQRDKLLSEYRRLSNLNMLKVAKKLVLLAQKADYLSKEKLKKELASIEKALQKSQPLANLDWIEIAFENLKQQLFQKND